VVIIDDVSQIHHCFIPFILRHGEGVWIVGNVDVRRPVRLPEGRVHPG